MSEEHQDRVRFSASQDNRRAHSEVALKQLIDSLNRERPTPEDTLKSLELIPTKHVRQSNKMPKYKCVRNPVLNADAFYVLPTKLLVTYAKLFPLANCGDNPVDLRSQSAAGSHEINDAPVEVVAIACVGVYTREQIETMIRFVNLR